MTSVTFTYQTRLELSPEQAALLGACAELYGMAERTLFARLCAGGEADKLKSEFCAAWGLTARQYNAVSVGRKGKIDSVKERRTGLRSELEHRILAAKKVLKKLSKPPRGEAAAARRVRRFKAHQKKRRLATLESKHAAMAADHKTGKARIAFGSKRLFRAQFALEANGYAGIDQWREEWRSARASQFLVLGSKDETAGCQGCVATLAGDETLTLRLRLPDSVVEGSPELTGKHALIEGVRFAYGHDNVVAALNSYSATKVVGTTGKSEGKNVRKVSGTALTNRFVRDEKGWRVFVAGRRPRAQRAPGSAPSAWSSTPTTSRWPRRTASAIW